MGRNEELETLIRFKDQNTSLRKSLDNEVEHFADFVEKFIVPDEIKEI